MADRPLVVDALQYSNWSEEIFRQMHQAGIAAVHVTICYHESFRLTVENIIAWNRRFERFPDLIFLGRTADDVRRAHAEGRTAIVFGFQNCAPIEDDIGLIEVCHQLGARFMQLTYNNQSLLATGCYETEDTGMDRAAPHIQEMAAGQIRMKYTPRLKFLIDPSIGEGIKIDRLLEDIDGDAEAKWG